MDYLHSIAGVAGLILIAWIVSEGRRAVAWRGVAIGVAFQAALAVLLLKVDAVRASFGALNAGVLALQASTREGTSFVFGYLGGGEAPFAMTNAGANFILAFQSLPLILVIAALSALLWHWRILPAIVRGFAFALKHTLGVGGAVGVVAAANIFVGMVEAPLLVKPYIARLTRSELFVVMTCGMATIAGTMLVLYATVISPVVENAVAHLLIASIINAPGGIVVARIMVPETKGGARTEGEPEIAYSSSMDAVARGTADGLSLFLYVIAMLVVLVALVALANSALGLLPSFGGAPVTLQRLLGIAMAPYVWLLGVPWAESGAAGALMGTKIVLNEFIAYLDLVGLAKDALGERSRLIMTYALCGFANLGSLGIMLGGLISMAPERRADIVSLGLKSILSGTLATSLTAAIVGLLT